MSELCPRCGARILASVPWCTLCYADLRPVAAGMPAGSLAPGAATAAEAGSAVGVDSIASAGPAPEIGHGASVGALAGWPCTRCGAVVPLDLDSCAVCGGTFMTAGAPGKHGAHGGLDALGSTPLTSRTKVVVMVSGAVGVGAVLLLGTWIVALFL